MHRNTAIVIAFLAIIAALLIGLTIGRKLSGNQQLTTNLPADASRQAMQAGNSQPSPSPAAKFYSHPRCGLSFTYPAAFQLSQASDSAQLTHPTTDERINLICGVEFPKPPLPPERIEEATITGVRATIYHDASAKDGSPVNVVVFQHPKTGLEIALFGFGEVFERILNSLKLF